jgi:hypothetical protein
MTEVKDETGSPKKGKTPKKSYKAGMPLARENG